MKQIVVLGCGRFGMSLAITLERLGNEVMVVDKDEEIIIILMFIGRVGPLTIIFSFYNKVNRKKFKYSNGNVIVG